MRKSKKIVCGIACICILLGVMMIGAGLAMGGSIYNNFRIRGDIFHLSSWKLDTNTDLYEGEIRKDVEDFHTLHLDINYGDIEIKQGNEFKVIIENVPEDEYTISQEDGVLTVKNVNDSIFDFGFHHFNVDYKFTIVTPQALDEINVYSDMGDIEIIEIESKRMKINQSMGKVSLQDVQISNTLRVDQSMGEIDFRGICEGDAEFSNSMGDSDIEILADETEYQYELSTSMGSIEVNGKNRGDGMDSSFENGNGKHRITVDNSMGDISLEFR